MRSDFNIILYIHNHKSFIEILVMSDNIWKNNEYVIVLIEFNRKNKKFEICKKYVFWTITLNEKSIAMIVIHEKSWTKKFE